MIHTKLIHVPFRTDRYNFIEIAISGVPKEKAIKVFMLSDDIKKEFDGMELGIGEVIKIQYFNNEREQNVIVKIEKMK
jgi:hypothetical protein